MIDKGVIYSIATKIGSSGLGIVSYHAVKALLDRGILKIAVSYGNKSNLPSSRVLALPGNPAKFLFFLPRHYYKPLRKGFFDYITSKIILKKGCSIFHGWNNQALRSIKAAQRIGAKAILECGSTHRFFRETLLNEEYERFGIKNVRPPEYARQSSLEEVTFSDFIFVASEFAKKTFIDSGINENKLFVIKRGVNLEKFKPLKRKNKKFKVLFVGRLSLRKGIQYLLEAWKKLNLKNAELVLAGSIDNNIKPILSKYNDIENLVLKGFLKDVTDVYKESTIFLFPSLEEGSAKVTYEALAAGLPVITTENSGSVVRNGVDGFIIPIRDTKAIMEKITYFYENPKIIDIMSANALENIKLYTWQRYRENIINIYNKLFI
ncbi:MAG: glycosyltransferase family 4 protein [Nitrospirae bacterium]|nr:glycosyltransferase family 4 protein [Nitrospirota bacterium]